MTIIKKFEPEEIEKKIPKKYLYPAILGLLILVLIEIWTNNAMIMFGEKYEKLSVLEEKLAMENQILENEISKNSSLKVIASKSAELGFHQTIGIQYIR